MPTPPRPRKFRYMNESVGILVILCLFIAAAGLFYAGRVNRWLNPGRPLKVILPQRGLFGLSSGATVEILGTPAGRVQKIVIDPDTTIHAEVRIRNDMASFVRRDSTATIRKRFGVAGEAFLDIKRGSGPPIDWDYAVIHATADKAPTDALQGLITEIQARAIPIMEDTQRLILAWASVADTLNDPESDASVMLANLREVTARVASGQSTLGRLATNDELIADLEKLLATLNQDLETLGPILEDFQRTSKQLARVSESVGEQSTQMPELTERVKSVLRSLDAVLVDLRKTTPTLPRIAENVEATTEQSPLLMSQIETTLAELEALLKQLRSNWLLGGGGEPRREPNDELSPLEITP